MLRTNLVLVGLRDFRLEKPLGVVWIQFCSYEELFRAVRRKVVQEFLNAEVSKPKEVGKPVAKQQNATDGQNVLEIVTGIPSDIK